MSVKQKLFLLLVAGFLITAPALADAANPLRVDDTSGFGTKIGEGFDIVSPPASPFTLSLAVEVFYDSPGVFTYVYTISHDAAVLNSIQILNNLYDVDAPRNWGWVDPTASTNPFVVPIDISGVGPSTIIQFVTGLGPGDDVLTFYIQSLLPPTTTETEMVFGSGTPEGGSGFLFTLGPTDAGGGASFGVPEPSTLLLLTFGLLGGGVLRFSTRRTRG